MVKKLLSLPILIFSLFLAPAKVVGQCPTSVGVTTNSGTTICAGEEITFTANPTGGSNLQYQWQVNGTNVPNETSSTFKTNSITNNQKVRVIVTSTSEGNNGCSKSSSEIAIIVEPIRTVTATIGVSNRNICAGETVIFTILSQTNIGSGSSYDWKVNGLSRGSTNSFKSDSLEEGDQIQLWVDSSMPCTQPVFSNIITIDEKLEAPAIPGIISGETSVCPGVSDLVYEISPVTNATSYEWTLPPGWTGLSTSNSITVRTANTGKGTISVRAKNECGTSQPKVLDVTVQDAAPPPPGAITGPTSVCPGVSADYSIAPVSRATEYVWTLPDDREQVTTEPKISVTTNTAGSSSDISVRARNSCGTSTRETLSVSLTSAKPATPGAINGNTAVCSGISQTYSIAAVPGATSYEWSLPTGWTGTGTTRSITVTTGTTGGKISVIAKSDCKDSEPKELEVEVNAGAPDVPVFEDPLTDVCPGETNTFTVSPVDGATEYIWTLPGGWSGSSTTNSIDITSANSGTGSITVQAKNDCGTSAGKTIPVAIKPLPPKMNAVIDGPSTVCASSSGIKFSIPEVAHATEYIWSAPGWTIINGQGTRIITVTSGSGKTTISVKAKNSCGESQITTKEVTLTTDVSAYPAYNLPVVDAGPDLKVCSTETSIALEGATAQNHTSLIWTTNGQGEISNATDLARATYEPHPDDTGETIEFTLTAILQVDEEQLCADAVDTKTISLVPQPVITEFSYTSTAFCQTDITIKNPTITGENAFEAGFFVVEPSSGLSIDANGNIDPSSSAAGSYTIVYNTPEEAFCAPVSSEPFTIVIEEQPIPSFNYDREIYCRDSRDSSLNTDPIITLEAGDENADSFSYTGAGTLAIDNQTGAIDLGSTTAGTYVIRRTVDLPAEEEDACQSVSAGFTITITDKPIADFSYGEVPFCSNAENPVPDFINNAVAGIFTAPAGVVIDSASGEINLSESEAGTHTITNTIKAADGCDEIAATAQVTITPRPVATFAYEERAYCKSSENPLPVFPPGGAAGAFSSTDGLEIDRGTGEIDLQASEAGTYIVTNTFEAAAGCETVSAEYEVTIFALTHPGSKIIVTLEEEKDKYENPSPAQIITACHSGSGSILLESVENGLIGEVERWESSTDAVHWQIIESSVDQNMNPYNFSNINATTMFRAFVQNGSCEGTYTDVAVVSVIPSIIPIRANSSVVCMGNGTSLIAESGFGWSSQLRAEGTFDTATPNDWSVDGTEKGLNAGENASDPASWRLASTTDHDGGYSGTKYTSDNKFAIAHGIGRTTELETPVFDLFGFTDAELNMDHSYSITGGAQLRIEISTDGGATYNKVLWKKEATTETLTLTPHLNFHTNSANELKIDLSPYAGLDNLKIKFVFEGNSTSSWALDNIDVPNRGMDAEIAWYNEFDEYLGNTQDINIMAEDLRPGVNIYKVTTSINGCRSEGPEGTTEVEVFAYDSYTAEASIREDQNMGCGNNSINLTAKVFSVYGKSQGENGEITEFTPGDMFTTRWTIEGMTEAASNDYFDDPTKPDAIFTSDTEGDYVLLWTVTPKNVSGKPPNPCGPSEVKVPVTIKNCMSLDFDGVDDFVDLGEAYNGNYSIEAWIRPETTKGTIISTKNLEVNMEDLTEFVSTNARWYHIAVDSDGKLYVDGINSGKTISKSGSERAFIGARWNAPYAENHFSGWIEEVRIWNGKISKENIRFTMNQRLKRHGSIGVEVDMAHPDAPLYSDLAGYYQLVATSILNGGYTEDLSQNPANGKLRNMETAQENTAPLPYTTKADGKWTDENGTWTHNDVWDIPHANGIDGTPITWNIVRTSHYVESGAKDIVVLGLIVEENELDILSPSGAHDETNSGQSLEVTHYLKLDGVLDLTGESQLLQYEGSIVDLSSSGSLERDQQGTASSYNYNYWSSPVSLQENYNSEYNVGSTVWDGTDSSKPRALDFGDTYYYADVKDYAPDQSKKISTYWLLKFHGAASNYFSWEWIGKEGILKVGEGFSMKGTSGSADVTDPQNYTFKGLPNNGRIELSDPPLSPGEHFLVGNPYPSAIDAHEFIADNLANNERNINVFNGSLYFWDHFAGESHYLEEYIGGYATYNYSGGIRAASADERINHGSEINGTKRPGRYIPVGQAFFVNSTLDPAITKNAASLQISSGNVLFKNSQRIYKREKIDKNSNAEDESVFHSQEKKKQGSSRTTSNVEQKKIWLRYRSPLGFHRQILVTADQKASNEFDLGYDAPMIEDNVEDMYWFFNDYEFVIQGVSHFNKYQELPLGIKVKDEGTIKISIDELRNIPDEMEIYIKDNLQAVYHNLREGAYETTADPGLSNDRLKIVFNKPAPEIEEGPVDGVVEENLKIIYVTGTREILVRNPQLYEISRIYLRNMLGQQVVVFEDVPEQIETLLPVRRFAAGVYLVRAHTGKGVVTKMVILE